MARWHPLAIVLGGGVAACFTKPGGPEPSVVADAATHDAPIDGPRDGSLDPVCARDDFDDSAGAPCGLWGTQSGNGGVALTRYSKVLIGGTSGGSGDAGCRTLASVRLDAKPQLRIVNAPNIDGASIRFEIINGLNEVGGVEIRGHTSSPATVHWNGPFASSQGLMFTSSYSYVRLVPGASITELRFEISADGTNWGNPNAFVSFQGPIDTVRVQFGFDFDLAGAGSASVDDFDACP